MSGMQIRSAKIIVCDNVLTIGAETPASYLASRVDVRWRSDERRTISDWASLRAMSVSSRLVAKMEVVLEDEAPYVRSAAIGDIVVSVGGR